MTVFLSIVVDISFAIGTAFILIISLFSALHLLLWFCPRQWSQWDHSRDHEPKCLKLAVIHDFENSLLHSNFPLDWSHLGVPQDQAFCYRMLSISTFYWLIIGCWYGRLQILLDSSHGSCNDYTVEFVILLILTLHVLNILGKAHRLGDTCFFTLGAFPHSAYCQNSKEDG